MKDEDKVVLNPEEDQVPEKAQETDKQLEEFARVVPPEVREALQKAPPEVRETVMSMVASMGRAPHPLFDKFRNGHVDKFLDYTEEDNKRSFIFANRGRWFQLGYVFLGLGFLIFLITYLLPNNKDLLINILIILSAFAGGFGFGYGYKTIKQ